MSKQSILNGMALDESLKGQKTLTDMLSHVVKHYPDKGIYYVGLDGSEDFQSYKELYHKALYIAQGFRSHGILPGDKVVLQIENNKKFFNVFWACIIAGVVPAPVTQPTSFEYDSQGFQKLRSILKTLGNYALVVDDFYYPSYSVLKEYSEYSDLKLLTSDNLLSDGEAFDNGESPVYDSSPENLAFLQFSSGSTGDPKGVMLTHGNLVSNLDSITRTIGLSSTDVSCCWLPHTHDMGLIGLHMSCLKEGMDQYKLQPDYFVRKPLLLLEKINQHRASITVAPNFALNWILKRVKEEQVKDFDLSCVRLLFNGSEPISVDIMDRFLETYGKYGFKKSAMYTVYGLAEASLAVTFPKLNAEPVVRSIDQKEFIFNKRSVECESSHEDAIRFADEGYAIYDVDLRIVDDNDVVVPQGTSGHIQIKGPNVTAGYYNLPEINEDLFCEDWLRTGDIGFVIDDRLIVCGRFKDIIFVSGRNLFANDIEGLIYDVDGIKRGAAVAVGVWDFDSDGEALLLFIKYRKSIESFMTIRQAVRKQINTQLGIDVKHVLPIKGIPTTTSGKIQRFKLRDQYLRGEFDAVISEIDSLLGDEGSLEAPRNEVEEKLLTIWQDAMNCKLGINSDFFLLGGNSLTAMTLISRVNTAFDIDLTIGELFRCSSIKDMAPIVAEKIAGAGDSGRTGGILPVSSKDDYFPVSSQQKRIYTLQLMDKSSVVYNLPHAFSLTGTPDVKKIETAFQGVIKQHPLLASVVAIVDDQVVLKDRRDITFTVEYADKTGQDNDSIIEEFVRPFDLDKDILFRVSLFKLAEEQYVMATDIHHIIADGISLGTIIEDFNKLYGGEQLTVRDISYKDYAYWQKGDSYRELVEKEGAFWLDMFKDDQPVLNLPTDFPRPAVQSFEGDIFRFTLSEEVSLKVKAFCRDHSITSYVLFLGIYSILLAKYSGQEDLIVGSAVSGRDRGDIASMVGLFINTLAIRTMPEGAKKGIDYLKEVKELLISVLSNQMYPFETLIEKLDVKRDVSRNPLFDVMLIVQNMDLPPLGMADLGVTPYPVRTRNSKFDLTLTVWEKHLPIACDIEFSTKLYSRDSIERMAGHFSALLEALLDNSSKEIRELGLLNSSDMDVYEGLNKTDFDYPRDMCLDTLFSAQAEKNPEKSALICKGHSVSYRELDEKSSILAGVLRSKGVRGGDVVGIMAPRTPEMIISLWAVLKAGAAYLPIDTELPQDRIAFMLEDCEAKVLLSRSDIAEKVGASCEVLDLFADDLFSTSPDAFDHQGAADDLAYIIYTSGSTGKPKGVMLSHRNVHNFSEGMAGCIDFSPGKSILCVTTISFDIFVLETIVPLLKGMTVVLADEDEQKDMSRLGALIRENSIDMVQMTPSRMGLLVDDPDGKRALEAVTEIMVGGEAFPLPLLEKLRSAVKAGIYNMYGPTETTVWSSVKEVTRGNITLGTPISNTQIYILDEKNNLQPVNVEGELCIAGDGVAPGYLNRPELTASRFVEDPFIAGGKMYRTGDKARLLSNGEIEYLGRTDFQVKIRGFRIELGEIENKLRSHPGVSEAVVIDRDDKQGTKFLCAYVIAKEEVPLGELRKYLSKDLPEYMVPTFFMFIDTMPLTPSGKVNRKKLPDPDFGAPRGDREYKAPETVSEKEMCAIFQETLGIDQVGVQDNFFDIGCHSVHLIQIQSKVQKSFKKSIELVNFFKYPTITAFLEFLEGGAPAKKDDSRKQKQLKQGKNKLMELRNRRRR